MSRALTVLGAVLLFSTAGCLYPHSRHSSRHRTHGSVYVGWRSHTPPPVVHSHGHGCGHVLVGAEWVVTVPVTRHGSVTPAPTSGRHDRGLHRGHDVAPPHVEYSSPSQTERRQGTVVQEVVSVLQESPDQRVVLERGEEQHVVLEQREVVQEHDGHPGRGLGHQKAQGQGHDKHAETQAESKAKAKGKSHDDHEETQADGHGKGKGKGHDKAKGKGHDKHDG